MSKNPQHTLSYWWKVGNLIMLTQKHHKDPPHKLLVSWWASMPLWLQSFQQWIWVTLFSSSLFTHNSQNYTKCLFSVCLVDGLSLHTMNSNILATARWFYLSRGEFQWWEGYSCWNYSCFDKEFSPPVMVPDWCNHCNGMLSIFIRQKKRIIDGHL